MLSIRRKSALVFPIVVVTVACMCGGCGKRAVGTSVPSGPTGTATATTAAGPSGPVRAPEVAPATGGKKAATKRPAPVRLTDPPLWRGATPPKKGGQPIAWQTDLGEALSGAKRSGKLVMLYVYADWFKPCATLEKYTWSDVDVRELGRSFICAKVNTEKDKETPTKYRVRTIPAVLFLRSDGTVITRVEELTDARGMAALMRKALRD